MLAKDRRQGNTKLTDVTLRPGIKCSVLIQCKLVVGLARRERAGELARDHAQIRG